MQIGITTSASPRDMIGVIRAIERRFREFKRFREFLGLVKFKMQLIRTRKIVGKDSNVTIQRVNDSETENNLTRELNLKKTIPKNK